MAYQPINVPNRQGAKQLDVEFEEPKEPEQEEATTVEVEEQESEPEIQESLEVDLSEDSEEDFEIVEEAEETNKVEEAPKPKKKRGRPKGSTNKKRDKRIQQLLEDKKREAERNAALEAKLEALEKHMHETNKASVNSRKETLEQSIEALQAQLKNAIEDDDAAAIVDIQNKMMRANMDYAAVNYELEHTPEEYEPQQKQQQQADVSPYALEWIDDHPEFSEDEEFHSAALGVNAKLLKMGFDPESPEFYEQLDKRLSKRYPEYFDTSFEDVVEYKEDDESNDSDSDIPQTVAGASRTPSGSTTGASAKSGRKKKNTVILTEEDQILCQKWGIDPVSFAKRKKALEGKEKGDYTDIQ